MIASSNIDACEIEKFNALAHEWWDINGPMKLLHQLNPLRLSYITQHIGIQDKKILDIGCGGGILSESLARLGAIVTGIDACDTVIEIAKQHAAQSNLSITYQKNEVELLAEKQEKIFDVIVCMEMLEHVPTPQSIIQSAAHLIKPDGFIFFSTINRNIKSFLMAIIGAEYILNMLPKGTHTYQKFIRPSELTDMALQAGLSLHHLQGISFRPLSNTVLFSDSIDVNYFICFKAV